MLGNIQLTLCSMLRLYLHLTFNLFICYFIEHQCVQFIQGIWLQILRAVIKWNSGKWELFCKIFRFTRDSRRAVTFHKLHRTFIESFNCKSFVDKKLLKCYPCSVQASARMHRFCMGIIFVEIFKYTWLWKNQKTIKKTSKIFFDNFWKSLSSRKKLVKSLILHGNGTLKLFKASS